MTHKATRVIIWESPHNHKTGGSNMCHYTHFTTEEREKSRVLKAQGLRTCLHKLKSTQQGLQIGNNTNIFLEKSPNFIAL